jgi:hypothetical protein
MTFTKFCSALGITAFAAVGLVYFLIKLVDDPKSSTKGTKPGENSDDNTSTICPRCLSRIRPTKNS